MHFFENLQEIALKGKRISGPLPAESLAQAKNLVYLNLQDSSLDDSFADVWKAVKTIEKVNLERNGIVGPLEIPETEMGNTTIKSLNVDQNKIGGRILPTLGQANSLLELSVNNNGLVGPIPGPVYAMVNIESLSFAGNEIEGTLSNEVYYMPNLRSLNLHGNNITGALPLFPKSL